MTFLYRFQTGVESFFATLEGIWIAAFERVATWTAPIPSAVTVSISAMTTLDLGWWWAACIAITLEGVGIVASHRWLQAKEWNATKKKTESEADETIGRDATYAYVAIAEIMIIAFEAQKIIVHGDPWGLTALPLPFLTIIMVRLGAERIVQNQREAERDAAKRPLPMATMAIRGNYGDFLAEAGKRNGNGITAREVQEIFSVPERTAYNWIEKYKNGRG